MVGLSWDGQVRSDLFVLLAWADWKLLVGALRQKSRFQAKYHHFMFSKALKFNRNGVVSIHGQERSQSPSVHLQRLSLWRFNLCWFGEVLLQDANQCGQLESAHGTTARTAQLVKFQLTSGWPRELSTKQRQFHVEEKVCQGLLIFDRIFSHVGMSSHLGCQGILQTWKFKLRLEFYIISLGGIYCAFGSLISANTPRALGPGKPGEFLCFLSQCLSIMNVYDPFNAHIFYRRHNIPHPLENFLLSTLYLRYQFHTTLLKSIYLYIYI